MRLWAGCALAALVAAVCACGQSAGRTVAPKAEMSPLPSAEIPVHRHSLASPRAKMLATKLSTSVEQISQYP